MGDVIDPKPPQWQVKQPRDDVPEDRVLLLANRLKEQLDNEVDSTLVQLTALRLVLKAVVGTYRTVVGYDAAKELMRQASEMCEQYEVRGINDDNDT